MSTRFPDSLNALLRLGAVPSAHGRLLVAAPVVLLTVLLTFGLTPGSTSATPLTDRQAEATKLDAQLTKLEHRLSALQERWRGARIELTELDRDIEAIEAELDAARSDLSRARVRLRARAIQMYQDGTGDSQLLEVAEAGSFSELFERVDALERVSQQDADILGEVDALRAHIEQQEDDLIVARAAQADVVRTASTAKRDMADVVDAKQAALDSVNAEIVAMMEAQRAAAAAAAEVASRKRVAAIKAGEDPDAGVGPGAADSGSMAPAPDAGGAAEGDGATDSSDSDESGGGAVSVPLPPASGAAASAAGIAMGKIGAAYVFGAAGPDSFDCSGLIMWAFAQAGRSGMPHSTYAYMGMGVSVPMSQAQVGDIVITDGGGHAGLYVGGGSFVHAPREGRTVAVESLSYYSVVDVRRV